MRDSDGVKVTKESSGDVTIGMRDDATLRIAPSRYLPGYALTVFIATGSEKTRDVNKTQ